MTSFASRIYNRLAKSEENLFLSPFSIQVALAMCGRGANGETRKAIASLIDAPLSNEEQDALYAELIKSVNGDGNRPFELVTANALWGDRDYKFKDEYKQAVANHYDGAFNVVDYAKPNEAAATINSWVAEKTKEKIKELVDSGFINKDTRLILTNAIYFKSQWDSVFDKNLTKEEDFLVTDSVTSKVQMMHKKSYYKYCDGDDYQAVELPYKGKRLALLVVLPSRFPNGLSALETRWYEEDLYSQVIGEMTTENVVLSLPRFKMETKFKLKPVLSDLGAAIAFSDDADFSGIGDEPLKISEVIHKAFVDVNEEGTEAAAATAVGMMRCVSMSLPDPLKVFRADHPFMFFIRDRVTNAILFSGHVHNPS